MNLEKTIYAIGILYVLGMSIWVATWIGKPACTEPYITPWYAPVLFAVLLGFPFLLGRWSK
jgi:hypothetical protein